MVSAGLAERNSVLVWTSRLKCLICRLGSISFYGYTFRMRMLLVMVHFIYDRAFHLLLAEGRVAP